MLLILLISVLVVACVIIATSKKFKAVEAPVEPIVEIAKPKVQSLEPVVEVPVEKAATAIAENVLKPKVKKPKANKGSKSKNKK